MSTGHKRAVHKQTLRQLVDRFIGSEHSDDFKEKLVDEIFRVGDRLNGNPRWLDEALNSGDGTYKP